MILNKSQIIRHLLFGLAALLGAGALAFTPQSALAADCTITCESCEIKGDTAECEDCTITCPEPE